MSIVNLPFPALKRKEVSVLLFLLFLSGETASFAYESKGEEEGDILSGSPALKFPYIPLATHFEKRNEKKPPKIKCCVVWESGIELPSLPPKKGKVSLLSKKGREKFYSSSFVGNPRAF